MAIYTSRDFTWNHYYLLYGALTKKLKSDRLDLIWLNQAEPIICFEVLKNGRLLFFRDRDELNELELKIRKRYYDYILYLKNTGWHRDMVYTREGLIKRPEKLKEYRQDLREL